EPSMVVFQIVHVVPPQPGDPRLGEHSPLLAHHVWVQCGAQPLESSREVGRSRLGQAKGLVTELFDQLVLGAEVGDFGDSTAVAVVTHRLSGSTYSRPVP